MLKLLPCINLVSTEVQAAHSTPCHLQARDAQQVNILRSVIWETAASSHVQRAADLRQSLMPLARGTVDSQGAGGAEELSQTAMNGADRATAATHAARHFSGLSSTATDSSAAASSTSAAARQPAQGSRQAPRERYVGSQLLREQQHQAERQLQQAVIDTLEVRPLC